MIVGRKCAKCGTALLGHALRGLCRKCLATLGFAGAAIGPDPSAPETPPKTWRFGDYELLGEIARGGMGVVYKARQLSLNRIVAVKMILHGPFSSAEFVERFQTEAKAAAGLQHPNIVAIYEVGQHDGQHYFSMEHIEGRDLAAMVRDQPLAARRAAGYLKSVAEGVEYAHQKGVLHRDLKPSNLLVDIFDQPRITDFGLARLVGHDSQLTVTGQTLGSPGYMAPEQAAGKSNHGSPQSDVYSLGAILYHLLTGRPPFQGETLAEVLLQVQNADPVAPRRLNARVPVPLQNICLKCLQKEPAKRYLSARALAEDLGRFLTDQPVEARPATAGEKLLLWRRRHPAIALLSAALLIAVLLGLGGVISQWRRAEALGRKAGLDLYAADVNLASHAFARGDYGLARSALAGLQPKPGQEDLRGFEWRYLWNLCRGDQLATLTGHTWIVTCAAFSPDGHTLVTGSQDGTAKLWDADRRQPIATLPPDHAAVWSAAFSPDGTRLMIAGYQGQTQLWDVAARRVVRVFPGEIAALSRTGSVLASAQSSPLFWLEAGNVVLWDYQSGRKLREIGRPAHALALSPDGQLLAVGLPGQGVEIWETGSGRLRRALATKQPVWSLAFSPGGDQLAVTDWANEALIWNLGGTNPPGKLEGHASNVWSANFSPDGSTIVTTSSDQTIRFWDAATLQPRNVLHGHANEVWCAAFSPDGKTLATGSKDQTVRLWGTGPAVHRDPLPHKDAARPIFSPDSARIALLDPGDAAQRRQLWDLAGGPSKVELPKGRTIGFSKDGSCAIEWGWAAAALSLWSLKDHTTTTIKLEGLPPNETTSKQMGFSPERGVFYAIDSGGVARFWEAANGRLMGSFQGPKPPIRATTLGPVGRLLAMSLERENSARLYETRTGSEIELTGHHDFVSGLSFSPDGGRLATASMDGTLKLWDTATGRELAALPGHRTEATDVAFSPDGRTLASVGYKDSIKLWHLATGRELLSLEFPQAGRFLQFSPDGRHLAVTTEADTIRLLEAPVGD
jgi:WD40 repeat protein/tRNA A-37 threonylcarbamoyl transferase component Bud32